MIRRRTSVAAAVLLLAVGACGAPAGQDTAGRDGDPANEAERFTSTTEGSPSGPAPRPTSPLASRTSEVGSAVYEPGDHVARQRSPTLLGIPAIGVDGAPVRGVGLAPNGEMEIPPASEVGWYRSGSAPGEAGSSVLAGHIAYDGVDGVFRNLDRVDPGDRIVVGFDDGSSETFRVTRLVTYRKEALPEEVFSAVSTERDTEQLVLITCGGDFNPSLRSYDSNVVAYAVPDA